MKPIWWCARGPTIHGTHNMHHIQRNRKSKPNQCRVKCAATKKKNKNKYRIFTYYYWNWDIWNGVCTILKWMTPRWHDRVHISCRYRWHVKRAACMAIQNRRCQLKMKCQTRESRMVAMENWMKKKLLKLKMKCPDDRKIVRAIKIATCSTAPAKWSPFSLRFCWDARNIYLSQFRLEAASIELVISQTKFS